MIKQQLKQEAKVKLKRKNKQQKTNINVINAVVDPVTIAESGLYQRKDSLDKSLIVLNQNIH